MKRSCEFEKLNTAAVMYGSAGLPELIPPTCTLRPSAVLPYSPGPASGDGPGAQLSSHPRRMHRAPKLGQIGRSKRVDLDDEDLDDIMNNNRSFPLSISVSPVA
ncbi:calcium/calmodulin-dependent protein kinase II inhibitor 2 [Neoarius graeffei]|uniref:calcium/calmodulin-dependent protein kinase II inhibitor 2 n=1 Tax=Neoarius graeffei TaxID=443677 RepID=UPI00298C0514|nr:calcium/calmodulin-dependent protein kinase II inhibitor 2 [Neoarius graeffei]XP_060780899.1 calcium/calmodulin-dependent protein kinase II inhibitor 2 [Neoarius graeffei]XP_060780905.1 calcium/calmodulin-dependent protein kinase II inhibitor 2 [Neoarius graeffei]